MSTTFPSLSAVDKVKKERWNIKIKKEKQDRKLRKKHKKNRIQKLDSFYFSVSFVFVFCIVFLYFYIIAAAPHKRENRPTLPTFGQ